LMPLCVSACHEASWPLAFGDRNQARAGRGGEISWSASFVR
jgi:hypothetical protein